MRASSEVPGLGLSELLDMSFIPAPAIAVIDRDPHPEGNERGSCVCRTAGAIGYSTKRLRVRRAIGFKGSGLAETSAE